jgi:LysM repeat protein
MKTPLLFATLSMVFTAPAVHAKSELETLRALCQEQERQIRQLENENTNLRSDSGGSHSQRLAVAPVLSVAAKTMTIANPAPAVAGTYTVKAGDSLEKIARKAGTSPEKLAKSNGLKITSVIVPGQKLKVPGTSAPASAAAAAAVPSPKTTDRTHTVQSGETFSSISRKHGISADALAAANPGLKPTALRPGQVIKLRADAPPAPPAPPLAQAKTPEPVEKSHAAEPSMPEPVPAPAPAAPVTAEQAPVEKAPPAAPLDKKLHPVAVDAEMTYGAFATKHGTNTERLNALNGLDLTDATVLAKGSELYVPAQP